MLKALFYIFMCDHFIEYAYIKSFKTSLTHQDVGSNGLAVAVFFSVISLVPTARNAFHRLVCLHM